ncbi:MAG: aminotransferase class V-fold PLP-dependent enzyme [Aigarchaeota archaeon]|nr:aminotransferase class V-fold PLP-dependent enzyme [Aigarchaeota archaeon]MDH5702921.1 aminotransferase class V-fold PLP-dependent enzyme [Aigarchaeota archaeon]
MSSKEVQNLRRQFPIVKKKVFMNHAAFSPPCRAVKEAYERRLREWESMDVRHWFDEAAEAKKLFSKLVNCTADEIAFTPNTSTGISSIATALSYRRGSNVVVTDLEYPAVTYTWLALQRKGKLEVRFVENHVGRIDPSDVERKVDDRTVALCISDVEFGNGFRNDMKTLSEIAHEHGAYMINDAIQSAGAMSVDVRHQDIDFLVAGGFKWLLGPLGTGYMYVREQLTTELETTVVGASSVDPKREKLYIGTEYVPANSAKRFETGSYNIIGYLASKEAIRLLINLGSPKVERRILHLTDYLIDKLQRMKVPIITPLERGSRSGIVTFKVRRLRQVLRKLAARNFILATRLGGVRASPHFYNTEKEIDKMVNELSRLI